MKKLLSVAPILLVFFFTNVIAQIPFWHQTSGPEAGTLRDMTIDSAGRIFVWTSGSGVYRSADTGKTWSLYNNGLPMLTMWRGAATTLKNGYLFVANNQQHLLFRIHETDPNAHWENSSILGDSSDIVINDIVADPRGEVYIAGSQHGVLRSDDNGATWLEKGHLKDSISKNSVDKNVSFLSIDGNGNLFAGLKYGVIFRSSDKGESWVKLPTRNPDNRNLNCLLAAPNGNLIIGNSPNTLGGKMYVSLDTAKTWKLVYQRPANTQEQKNNIDKIIRVPGSNVLYANAHGPTLRSVDYGVTWSIRDTDKRGDEAFSMAAIGNNVFQLCEPDGIFLSNNNGDSGSWVPKNKGFIAQNMWGIAINSKQDLFGITEYGLFRSSDNGDSWDHAPEYGEDYSPSIYINKKDIIFIGLNRGLFRSKDNGNTIEQLIFNHDTGLKSNSINQVGEDRQGKLFCASKVDSIGFLYSTDEGDHWIKIRNLPDTSAIITTFAFASKDTMLLARAYQTDFYRSTDRGMTWQLFPSDIQGASQVLIHPDGFYLTLVGDKNGGIYSSVDGAKSWQKIFPPADFQETFTAYFSMMIDDKGSIIVCTDSGIYRSVTGDRHFSLWPNVSAGLTAHDFPNHFVNTTQVVENPVTRVFFAATRGLGVFRSIPGLDVIPGGKSPLSLSSITARPNPFTSQTIVSFKLEKRGDVNLDVYDVLGKQIRSLFEGILDEGNYSASFDGSSLPNGNYLLMLRDGSGMRTVWVTLTK